MSRYNVFDGGNELRHYDDFTSGISGYDNVRPAQHHSGCLHGLEPCNCLVSVD